MEGVEAYISMYHSSTAPARSTCATSASLKKPGIIDGGPSSPPEPEAGVIIHDSTAPLTAAAVAAVSSSVLSHGVLFSFEVFWMVVAGPAPDTRKRLAARYSSMACMQADCSPVSIVQSGSVAQGSFLNVAIAQFNMSVRHYSGERIFFYVIPSHCICSVLDAQVVAWLGCARKDFFAGI